MAGRRTEVTQDFMLASLRERYRAEAHGRIEWPGTENPRPVIDVYVGCQSCWPWTSKTGGSCGLVRRGWL